MIFDNIMYSTTNQIQHYIPEKDINGVEQGYRGEKTWKI